MQYKLIEYVVRSTLKCDFEHTLRLSQQHFLQQRSHSSVSNNVNEFHFCPLMPACTLPRTVTPRRTEALLYVAFTSSWSQSLLLLLATCSEVPPFPWRDWLTYKRKPKTEQNRSFQTFKSLKTAAAATIFYILKLCTGSWIRDTPSSPSAAVTWQQCRNPTSLLIPSVCNECLARWDRDKTIWPWQGVSRYKK